MNNKIASYLSWLLKNRLRREKNGIILAVILLILLAVSFFITPVEKEVSAPTSKMLGIQHCQVIHISDGDSIRADCGNENRNLRIRIWGIDAPEMGQKPWGNQAKKHLTQLIGTDKSVEIDVQDIDRYGRSVAKIYKNNQDLGLNMVAMGQAVVYHRYNQDDTYKKLEIKAKKDRIGVWSKAGGHQSPEQWRRLNRR